MKIKKNFLLILILAALLSGCKNLYFGTSTSVGLDVSGTSKIPTKASFAFDRSEIAIVPDDSEGNAHSVFASLDSEWTWFNGFIVDQIFATGEAADIAATEPRISVQYDPKDLNTSKKPLVFATGTKLGIDIDFGLTASAPASLLVGYKRSEMTIIPDVAGKKKLNSVFADISIISKNEGVTSISDAPRLGGVRIKQRFATGVAAVEAATNPDFREKLRKAVYGDPVLEALESAKTRFDKEGAVKEKFDNMDPAKQNAYLQILNATFGKSAPNQISAANLQIELGNLNDTQLEVAAQQIQSF